MILAERIEELIEEIDLDGALEMIEIFLYDPEFGISKRLNNLEVSLNNKDGIALSKEAHILKGSASNFEATDVVQLSGLLEEQGIRNELEKAQQTFNKLKDASKILMGELVQIKQRYV
jgi:HPt (histidine-containing phosphotransfer) domain-containing protein